MIGFLLATFLSLLCLILILLILIQRGKGGGLAGAFGGMGGQSAFGTKAGDTFMRITIVFASVWFLICIGIQLAYKQRSHESGLFKDQPTASVPANPSETPAVPIAGANTTDSGADATK
ncbi:MAG: preprotein translocase subunit SecG [Planctomycetaceae bacterium]|jgi:preprotein translocase subunit SecG|nr:preprotein translocase subunit SecG [Planctomycetaceae bacterium]